MKEEEKDIKLRLWGVQAVIDRYQEYFDGFLKLPIVLSVVFGIIFLCLGAALSYINKTAVYLLIFFVGGAVVCFVVYIMLKLIIYYFVLHLYYLRKISLQNSALQTKQSEEKLP